MDGGGGACIARYTGGGGASGGFREITYGMSKVERIMLKFRPIAPKPTAAGSGSSCSTAEHSDGYGGNRRRKRRYVRVNRNKKEKDNTNSVSKKRRVSSSSEENSGGGDAAVTLCLMPETPDRKENSPAASSPGENPDLHSNKPSSPVLLSFNNYQQTARDTRDSHVRFVTGHDTVMIPSPSPKKSVVTSLVTVECVTDTWTNINGLGFTDRARVANMEMDTCPSFVTDGGDEVVWTNTAYRKMTARDGGGSGGSGDGSDETVMVVVKKFNRVKMPVTQPAAFTCNVKVTWGAERGASPLTVTAPCDVWRLSSGGYAWRLDVNAALCLGRYI